MVEIVPATASFSVRKGARKVRARGLQHSPFETHAPYKLLDGIYLDCLPGGQLVEFGCFTVLLWFVGGLLPACCSEESGWRVKSFATTGTSEEAFFLPPGSLSKNT